MKAVESYLVIPQEISQIKNVLVKTKIDFLLKR